MSGPNPASRRPQAKGTPVVMRFGLDDMMLVVWSLTAAIGVSLFVILLQSGIKHAYARHMLRGHATLAKTDIVEDIRILQEEGGLRGLLKLRRDPEGVPALFVNMALAQSGAEGLHSLEQALPAARGMDKVWTLAGIESAKPGTLATLLSDASAEPAAWLEAVHAAALVEAYAKVDFGRQMEGRYICLFPGKKEVDPKVLSGFENGLNRLLTDPNEDTDPDSGVVLTKATQLRRFLDEYLAKNPDIYKVKARQKWQARFESFALKQLERRDVSLRYKRLVRQYLKANAGRFPADGWQIVNRLMSEAYLDNPVDLRAPHDRAARDDGTVVVTAHAAAAMAVAVSSADGRVASGGFDNLVKIWPADGQGRPLVLAGHSLGVLAVAWAPDGKTLASAGLDGTIRLWDSTTGAETRQLPAETARVGALAYFADGMVLAAVGPRGKVRLLDPLTGKVLKTLSGPKNEVTALSVSQNGRYVVAGCYDKTAVAWDLFAGAAQRPVILPEPPGKFLMKHNGQVLDVAVSPNGKFVATGCFDKAARLFDLTNEDAKGTLLKRHLAPVAAVAWAPDSSVFAAFSIEGKLILWDPVARGIFTMHLLAATANAVAFSQDGRYVIAACDDGTLRRWQVVPHEVIARTFSEWAVDFFGKNQF